MDDTLDFVDSRAPQLKVRIDNTQIQAPNRITILSEILNPLAVTAFGKTTNLGPLG